MLWRRVVAAAEGCSGSDGGRAAAMDESLEAAAIWAVKGRNDGRFSLVFVRLFFHIMIIWYICAFNHAKMKNL